MDLVGAGLSGISEYQTAIWKCIKLNCKVRKHKGPKQIVNTKYGIITILELE